MLSKSLIFACFIFATLALTHMCHAQNSPQDYVNAHNAARAAVGVGNIQWDNRVAQYAQQYANQRKGDCALRHSGSKQYGENIATGSGAFLTGTAAVKLWVDEKADYNYNSNTCAPNKVCGHYTQVVWRNSVRLGCARVQCNNGGYFVTCNYDPPGNWVGQKPY
ncbi:pathogenesis-related protein PR-1 type-like [Chenopodium quinoa]|uniref:pathogenesis-related protein PR-1 type-like n=1 Tax=Chenopodium quinoa TaxID=63459 RepID=UPI000B787852|nr:pathogenesis-related protein PR-1 type-like [Chenopodium quinoa]